MVQGMSVQRFNRRAVFVFQPVLVLLPYCRKCTHASGEDGLTSTERRGLSLAPPIYLIPLGTHNLHFPLKLIPLHKPHIPAQTMIVQTQ